MFFVSIQGRGKHHEFQGREVIREKISAAARASTQEDNCQKRVAVKSLLSWPLKWVRSFFT